MLKEEPEFPRVSIIILNWKGWNDTIECLESLFQIDYPNFEVIVVDNASNDNSVKKIKEYCLGKIQVESLFFKFDNNNKPINVFEYTKRELEKGLFSKDKSLLLNLSSNRKLILILNDKNYMFVEGNNIPIREYIMKRSNVDFILLLNNDTVVEKNFLKELVLVAKKNKKIGILGPRICYYSNPDLNEWPWLQKYENLPIEAPRNYLNGAAILFRIELIKTIGILDSRYIHYFEEIDYCLSAKKVGYKIIYVPTNSRVLHKGGMSHKKVPQLELYFRARNYFITMRKHFSTAKFLEFILEYFTKQIFLEFIKYPRGFNYVLKGVFAGILLILKDKTLLIKR